MNDAIGYRLQAKVQRIRHSCSSSAVLNQDDPDLEVSQRCFWEAGDWVGSKQQAEIQNPPQKKESRVAFGWPSFGFPFITSYASSGSWLSLTLRKLIRFGAQSM